MSYSIVERGSLNTLNYKAYFVHEEEGKSTGCIGSCLASCGKVGPGSFISPFHDIPLQESSGSSDVFNMIVEIPRWTNAKFEMTRDEKLNPIKQDIKKGKPRYINNCFPHHGYIWNYGAMPQTWEDPEIVDKHTQKRGDNDPVDICEIGYKVQSRGTVLQVKVLGVIALIDEEETDWKVIAIDVNDPLAKNLNDIDDVEKHMPGLLKATNEWFTIYKVPTGKPPNDFAFDGEAKDKAFALEIIKEANEHWKKLIQKTQTDASISIMNTTLTGNSALVSQEEAKAIVEATEQFGSPDSIPEEVSKWDYVKL